MYKNINTLTSNLIDNYMSITNKKDIEKRKLSPSDYLMFRQEAINELENGVVDINIYDNKNDMISKNDSTNEKTNNVIKAKNVTKKIDNTPIISTYSEVEDMDEFENGNNTNADLLSILKSVKG